MAGPNGTGKTYAALQIFKRNKTLDPQMEDIFITQSELNILWLEDIEKYGSTLWRMNQLRNANIFVLDDLGTRIPTSAFMDFLYAILDYRKTKQKPTIITTNLNSKTMREQFGDALVSRIASEHVIKFEGGDRRFKNF